MLLCLGGLKCKGVSGFNMYMLVLAAVSALAAGFYLEFTSPRK